MRLEKLLFEAGYGSKRKIKQHLYSKQVSVDGQIVMDAGLMVEPTLQDIRVAGQKIDLEPHVYYLLHKPKGVVTAVRDDKYPTVLDLIAPEDRREGLYPVGRLDFNTTGLLLLTTNGPLGYRLLHPDFHVTKEYEALVNGYLGQEAIDAFAKGIVFRDGYTCLPAQLSILEAGPDQSLARVRIQEGQWHQVRKMFLAVGVKVLELKRLSFGNLVLPADLLVGAYRPLSKLELNDIF